MRYIVTISPQGQITIPGAVRKNIKGRKLMLDAHGQKMVLKPLRIFVTKESSPEALAKLSKWERMIYSGIREKPGTVDELFDESFREKGIDLPLLLQTLMMLEIKDLIRNDGGRWMIT